MHMVCDLFCLTIAISLMPNSAAADGTKFTDVFMSCFRVRWWSISASCARCIQRIVGRLFCRWWGMFFRCSKAGWAINLARASFRQPRTAKGSTFQWKLKQVSIQVSLSANVYCDELEDISDLKIFLNASAGHWKHCGVAREPLLVHFCSKAFFVICKLLNKRIGMPGRPVVLQINVFIKWK